MTVKMGATDRQGISSLFWVSASIALITVFNLRFRYDGPAGRLRWHKRKCERLRRTEKHTTICASLRVWMQDSIIG